MAWRLFAGFGPWLGHMGFVVERHQIFWEVVGLERGPLSLMSTIEELLERNVAAPS
jgi:hypothetical protein